MEQSEYIRLLEERTAKLEQKLIRAEKINNALMKRVEKSTLMSDSDYSIFESNAILEELVKKQTREMSDITKLLHSKIIELQNVESVVSESKNKLQSILSSIDDIVWSLSYPDYNLLFINEAASKIYGYPIEEFYSNKNLWLSCILSEDREAVVNGIDNIHDSGSSQVVYRIIRSDGQIRYMLDKSKAIFDENRNILRIEGVTRDVTELKQYEEQLKKSKMQYELIFESTSDGIVVFDLFGSIVAVNSQACNILSYTKAELLGRNAKSFVSLHNAEKFDSMIKKIAAGEKITNEVQEKRKDGELLQLEIRGSAFVYEGEKLVMILMSDISDRLKNQEMLGLKNKMLLETEFKLNAILNNSNQSFVLFDKQAYILAFNNVAKDDLESFMHISDFEVGMNFREIVPTILLEIFNKNFKSALAGETVSSEQKFLLGNGQSKYYSFIYKPVVNSNGEIESVVLNARDTTDAKLAESRLSEQKTFLEIMINTIPSPVFYKNTDGVYIGCNKAFEEFIGLCRDEIIGKTVYDLSPPDLADKYHAMDKVLFESVSKQVYEYQMVTKSNATKYVIYHKATFTDQDNNIAGLIGIIVDITDRKTIESKLIASQSELQTIYDSTPILMCVIDEDFKIKNANLSFMKSTGWPDKSFMKSKVGNVLSCIYSIEKIDGCGSSTNCNICPLRSALKDTMKTGKPHYKVEFKVSTLIKNRNKTDVYLVSTARIYTPDKMLVLISFQDVSELKEIERHQSELLEKLKVSKDLIEINLQQKNMLIDELEKSKDELRIINAEKDKFLSVLAHDLRNPFNLIKNHTESLLLKYEEMSKEDHVSMLIEINNSTTALYKLLENLLTWSRIQTGNFYYEPAIVDLYEIAYNTVYTLESVAKEKHIAMESFVLPGTYIEGDYYMTATIFRNLIGNSLKFTNKHGFVRIHCEKFNQSGTDFYHLTFEDNGIGMNEEQIASLFRIDQTVSRPGTNNEGGTGLGLILCREFVEKLSGMMWVDSSPGVGTKIHITFPVQNE